MPTNKAGYWKEWYQKNKARIRPAKNEYNNKLRKLKPELFKGYRKKHYEQHKEELCLLSRKHSTATRNELVALLGNICVKCGTTEDIQIDHIQAGGSADRIVKGGSNRSLYLYYIKNPTEAKEKLQLLCRKHNLEKEFTNGENKIRLHK